MVSLQNVIKSQNFQTIKLKLKMFHRQKNKRWIPVKIFIIDFKNFSKTFFVHARKTFKISKLLNSRVPFSSIVSIWIYNDEKNVLYRLSGEVICQTLSPSNRLYNVMYTTLNILFKHYKVTFHTLTYTG